MNYHEYPVHFNSTPPLLFLTKETWRGLATVKDWFYFLCRNLV